MFNVHICVFVTKELAIRSMPKPETKRYLRLQAPYIYIYI